MSERVLVVISHPDDEIGCAGTLAKHVRAGDNVVILSMSNGCGSREGMDADIRGHEFVAAIKHLGIDSTPLVSDFPDNQFDTVPQLAICKTIELALADFKPSIVYTHWTGDMNVDHRITARCALVACRPQPVCVVRKILHFEVPCSTSWGCGFEPDYWVDISDTIAQKLRAFECYASELREPPHPRSGANLTTMGMWRGAQVGMKCAEAFVVGRMIA